MYKYYKIILIVLLTIFSFYYTNKTIDFIREADPIMKEIKHNRYKFDKKSINASVGDFYMIPGINGVLVDTKKSYSKMKRYGKYNENLLVFKEEEPAISLDDIYDRFIIGGNGENRKVALVFIIRRDDKIDHLLDILSQEDVKATFFMDGLFIENNQDLVKNLTKSAFEVELLSYNGRYQKKYFKYGIDLLKDITNIRPKYCYASYSSEYILDLCNNLSMHTIIPNINPSNRAYQVVKRKLVSGSIISLKNKDYILEELTTIISYIKQKGYDIVNLNELLSEKRFEEE